MAVLELSLSSTYVKVIELKDWGEGVERGFWLLLFSLAFELPSTIVEVAARPHCVGAYIGLGSDKGGSVGGGAHGDRHVHWSLKRSGLLVRAGG